MEYDQDKERQEAMSICRKGIADIKKADAVIENIKKESAETFKSSKKSYVFSDKKGFRFTLEMDVPSLQKELEADLKGIVANVNTLVKKYRLRPDKKEMELLEKYK